MQLDERREVIVPGNKNETVEFAADHFLKIASDAIKEHKAFYVALSGGSTPKAIFELLSGPKGRNAIDWTKVHLFWSDERSVPPTDKDSNYKMAMDAGLDTLPIPKAQIHRMPADVCTDESARKYEDVITQTVPQCRFDLIMLGMGDDGHTASLFPRTEALEENDRLVVPNEVQQLKTWRMTFTYHLINLARHIAIYVIGAGKAPIVRRVLTGTYTPIDLPIQRVGTVTSPAQWILDQDAWSKGP